MNRFIAIAAAVALSGCSTADLDTITSSIPLQPVNVVSDSFCVVSRKVSWSVTDTWQTIDDARRHNERIDKLCGSETPAKSQPAVKLTS